MRRNYEATRSILAERVGLTGSFAASRFARPKSLRNFLEQGSKVQTLIQ
jgi:hypothetical protein